MKPKLKEGIEEDFSVDEVWKQFNLLCNDLDALAALHVTAAKIARKDLDRHELFNEAIVRMMDGRRKVKRTDKLGDKIIDTMFSIANEMRKRTARNVGYDTTETEEISPLLSKELSPHEVLETFEEHRIAHKKAMAEHEEIQALFADDPDCKVLLNGYALGHTRSKLFKFTGFDKKKYQTTLKRFQRKLDKHYPERRNT